MSDRLTSATLAEIDALCAQTGRARGWLLREARVSPFLAVERWSETFGQWCVWRLQRELKPAGEGQDGSESPKPPVQVTVFPDGIYLRCAPWFRRHCQCLPGVERVSVGGPVWKLPRHSYSAHAIVHMFRLERLDRSPLFDELLAGPALPDWWIVRGTCQRKNCPFPDQPHRHPYCPACRALDHSNPECPRCRKHDEERPMSKPELIHREAADRLDPEIIDMVMARLAEPFDPNEVKFKPAVVKGNRALALAYIDARVVQDRLDEVLGLDGWQDEYERMENDSVVCRLRCRIGSEWILKTDVGSPSEQPDEGDRMKAAFSDALKRAAVKFGIGRYLYRLPQTWCDYDPAKKQFTRLPRLPQPGSDTPASAPTPTQAPKPEPTQPTQPAKSGMTPEEFETRLRATDADLAARNIISQPGLLIEAVRKAGMSRGLDAEVRRWPADRIPDAIETVKNLKKKFEELAAQHAANGVG